MEDRKTFYPFKIPPVSYNEHKVVSEEKYEDMYKQGLLKRNTICPVFLKKIEEKKKEQEPPKVEEKIENVPQVVQEKKEVE